MEYREFYGKNIDEALTNATVSLGVPSEMLDYEVIDKGSAGIFGFASKDACIKAKVKEEEKSEEASVSSEEVSNEFSIDDAAVKDSSFDNDQKPGARNATGESLDDDVLEKAEEIAVEFLKGLCQRMNIEVNCDLTYDNANNSIDIVLSGDDMGVLIGKRGATLDSLQYLTNLAVNRKINDFVHVTLDTENYRERRKKTLENLARNVAYRVKKTHSPVALESMNAYERRIIHAALSDDPYVTTHSEGEEPYRHVVVTLK
jgi:spoIIIJ-associated protein